LERLRAPRPRYQSRSCEGSHDERTCRWLQEQLAAGR
jgi:hypothetical protein